MKSRKMRTTEEKLQLVERIGARVAQGWSVSSACKFHRVPVPSYEAWNSGKSLGTPGKKYTPPKMANGTANGNDNGHDADIETRLARVRDRFGVNLTRADVVCAMFEATA